MSSILDSSRALPAIRRFLNPDDTILASLLITWNTLAAILVKIFRLLLLSTNSAFDSDTHVENNSMNDMIQEPHSAIFKKSSNLSEKILFTSRKLSMFHLNDIPSLKITDEDQPNS
jgi:hypothetical protein